MQLVKQFNVGLVPAFRREEDEGGASGGDPLAALNGDLPGGEGDDTPQAPTTPTAPAFDPESLARTVSSSVAEVLKQSQPAPQAKQITLEEAKAALNFYEIDDTFLQQFDNLDTKKAALEQFRDGIIKYAYGIVTHMLKDRDSQIETRYQPTLDFVQSHQAEQRQGRFNKTYEQLSHPSFAPVINAVIGELTKDPAFKNKAEGDQFKAIASGVEAVIKQANPQFKLNPAAGAAKNGNASGLPVTTPGGGGGGSRGSGSGRKTGNPVIDLL